MWACVHVRAMCDMHELKYYNGAIIRGPHFRMHSLFMCGMHVFYVWRVCINYVCVYACILCVCMNGMRVFMNGVYL